MEIEVPEGGIHTWRDFFIHMGTICLGLLIALGLEHEVEALHQRHERHKLEDSLRAEAIRNIGTLNENLKVRVPDEQWVAAAISQLNKSVPARGMVTVTLPPSLPGSQASLFDRVNLPSRGVWTAAKTNGDAALLGTEEAQVYNRLDYEGEKYLDVTDLLVAAEDECYGAQARLTVKLRPGETLKLKTADRDELVRLLAQVLGHLDKLNVRTEIWAGAADAIASGTHTYDEMTPYIDCRYASFLEGNLVPRKCPTPRPPTGQ
jgi:hypothetical protein